MMLDHSTYPRQMTASLLVLAVAAGGLFSLSWPLPCIAQQDNSLSRERLDPDPGESGLVDLPHSLDPLVGCVGSGILCNGLEAPGNRAVQCDHNGNVSPWRMNTSHEIQDNFNIDLMGRWIGGMAISVAVRNSIVFTSVPGGLIIIDFSSPGAPVELASYPLPGVAGFVPPGGGMAIAGPLVYVARGKAGLRILDISDPSAPFEVGQFDTDGEAIDVAITGNHVFVADQFGGLRICDISDPITPVEIGFLDTGNRVFSVKVAGNYAYLAEGEEGLRIIDISDPTNPLETGHLDTPGEATAVDVSGGHAYVADNYEGLRVINVSNPAIPQEVSVLDLDGATVCVTVENDYAYVGSGIRFFIIDISQPTNPIELESRSSWGSTVNGIAIESDRAYIANADRGVRVRDLSDPTDADVLGQHVTGEITIEVAVQGDYAYVAGGSPGMWVLDVSVPNVPIAVGRYDTGVALRVAVRDSFAYVGNLFGGVTILSISNPSQPVEVGTYAPDNSGVYDLVLDGDYLYTCQYGLEIIDVSDPTSPVGVAVFDTGVSTRKVAVSGDYAYLSEFISPYNTCQLRVLNISDPTSPFEESVFPLDDGLGGVSLDVSGNFAHIGGYPGGLHVIDVSNPAELVGVGSLDPGNWFINGITSQCNYAYLAHDFGLSVVDVSNPAIPTEVGFYYTEWIMLQTAVDGDRVFASDHWYGMYIFEFKQTRRELFLDIKPGSCPNPLNVNIPNGPGANGGVLPVAILGSGEFEVTEIDLSSLLLEGAPPLRHSYQDIATPPDAENDCACSDSGPDGFTDLTLKFRRLDVVAALGKVYGDDVLLTLTGRMQDGTAIELSDCVKIVPLKGGPNKELVPMDQPLITTLEVATPNPFNPSTKLSFEMATAGHARLKVYDISGRIVVQLVDQHLSSGGHEVIWDGRDETGRRSSAGVYFYRLEVGDFVETKRMTLVK